MTRYLLPTRLLCLVQAASLSAMLIAPSCHGAQDPFAAPPAAVEPSPAAGSAADPFGGAAPEAGPIIAPDAPAAPPAPVETNPAVRAILASNPRLPDQLIVAARALVALDRPEEAKKYLAQLLAAGMGDTALAELQQQFGSGLFVQWVAEPRLEPQGRELGLAVLNAAHRELRRPDKLAEATRQLSDPRPLVRARALEQLAGAGHEGTAALIGVLADSTRRAEHAAVGQALLAADSSRAVPPLLAALDSPPVLLQTQAATLLGQLGASAATTRLMRWAVDGQAPDGLRQASQAALRQITGIIPSSSQVISRLREEANQALASDAAWDADESGQVSQWQWNAEKQTVTLVPVAAELAPLLAAVRSAQGWIALAPEDDEAQRTGLLAMLDLAKRLQGLDEPLPAGPGTAAELARQAGPVVVEDVLAHCLDGRHVAAAIAATELLGQIGDAGLLLSPDGRPRPLALALQHSDRRLRFAALDAILHLDPQRPFAGSSHVVELLGYFARQSGRPRVLIGHQQLERGQTLAATFASIGYDAESAQNGRDVFLKAAHDPDYEAVLLSDGLSRPGLHELIQWFRRDLRTARLPLGVMAREERLLTEQQAAEGQSRLRVFPQVYDTQSAAYAMGALRASAPDAVIPQDVRRRWAEASLDHLARLLEQPERYRFYELGGTQASLARALQLPELAPQAARCLGLLGNAAAQQMLVMVANQASQPLAVRQAAVTAFGDAVRQRGLLLTTAEIQRQYDRYNQSRREDRGSQQVLGLILDAMEAPLAAASPP